MVTLERALLDLDPDLLQGIANLWDLDFDPDQPEKEVLAHLVAGMTRPEAVQTTWSRLSDAERGALAALQATEGRSPFARFTRRFGAIRPMGPARREREKPWLEPANVTESGRSPVDRASRNCSTTRCSGTNSRRSSVLWAVLPSWQ